MIKSPPDINYLKALIYILVPIIGTIMQSKEERVLELFFNYPTKEWHFEEIVRSAKIARSKAAEWLKLFVKDGIVLKIKEKNKMPHYRSAHESAVYRNRKKLFAHMKLYTSGFLTHLSSLPKAKTIILFGSFSRSDWYKESDVDVFIYGDPEELNIARYESKLHKTIELFICENIEKLSEYSEGFIKNIIKGTLIKGDLDFIRVTPNAQILKPKRSI